MTEEQMRATAPAEYFRRHIRPRCNYRCAAMVGAFIGLGLGMIALVFQ